MKLKHPIGERSEKGRSFLLYRKVLLLENF